MTTTTPEPMSESERKIREAAWFEGWNARRAWMQAILSGVDMPVYRNPYIRPPTETR